MGVLEVIFYTFLAELKKGMKMKVARKGPMCNPIEPARSDCMSAVVEKASFWDPFWSRFGVQVRYYTHFWKPEAPNGGAGRESRFHVFFDRVPGLRKHGQLMVKVAPSGR